MQNQEERNLGAEEGLGSKAGPQMSSQEERLIGEAAAGANLSGAAGGASLAFEAQANVPSFSKEGVA